jgi:hypothetical protein
MESKAFLIEPLLERVEEYGKTSFELLKLKSVDKSADIASSFLSRVLLTVIIVLFAITLNTGVALLLGDWLGKAYYGFLLVASFYCLVGIILYFIHPSLKAQLKNVLISRMLN